MAGVSEPRGTAPPRPPVIKVMVVDDSPTMRDWLSFVIDRDPRLHVVAQAANAHEARARIKQTAPDVLTLDLDLPQMNGLEFLAHLMRLRPMPVIVFSGLLASQGKVASAAMKLGAFSCIPKPASPDPKALSMLCDSLVAAGTAPDTSSEATSQWHDQVVLMGASTGGVAAIEAVLSQFTRRSPPVVVAQHMPQRFLESFAERLNRGVSLNVQLATSDAELRPGSVYLAQAQGQQTCVEQRSGRWHIALAEREAHDAFCPSVDRLFFSAVPWAGKVGALLLTGLGDDGARGMLSLLRSGGRTVGQSRDSCVVYGMPGAARALGAVENEVDVRVAGTTLLHMMEQSA
ncbi:MAG: chemotaxis protein CheB [Pseudomonadota bacterium]